MVAIHLVRYVPVIIALVAAVATPAAANIDLELRTGPGHALVGDLIDVALYTFSDSSANQSIAAMDVLLQWDPLAMELVGLRNDGPYTWLSSRFPNDSGGDGLNNTFADGDAKYTALSQFSTAAWATPSGLRVTTFEFRALAPATDTLLEMPAALGTWSQTRVFGTDYPNQNVTGILTGLTITIVPDPPVLMLLVVGAAVIIVRARHPRLRRAS